MNELVDGLVSRLVGGLVRELVGVLGLVGGWSFVE